MQPFDRLLLDIWREACRHIRIEESAATIAELLREQMPLAQLLVRQIDLARSHLETVAMALAASATPPDGGRTECGPDAVKQLLAWCNRREVAHSESGDVRAGMLRLIAPASLTGDLLAAPLRDQNGPTGILLLATAPGGQFGPADKALVPALVEPFSVALQNDRRLREIAALREAAEADRTSLLSRLGRQTLGDTIVGEASGLKGVMERVELVGRSDVPVLIFGETGTGKELVARAIHGRSARTTGPFLRVNCGAIPAELIDSQLFGHERGSFTGATETHRGWFERADRGTLFLDEIGELPLAAQVRLLRVLQDGVFERVGGQQSVTVDVRIVAATHRDLSGMVREGKFREDLWYRLAVFPIDLPPLRQRVDDIPALARHLAHRAAIRFGLAVCEPSAEDLRLLIAYAWPGNVRELAAVVDRAAILGDGRRLEVSKALGVQTAAPPPPAAAISDPPAPPSQRLPTLDQAMRQHIETALKLSGGQVEGPRGAALMLDINPHTLRARMRKLGVDWKKFRSSSI